MTYINMPLGFGMRAVFHHYSDSAEGNREFLEVELYHANKLRNKLLCIKKIPLNSIRKIWYISVEQKKVRGTP